MSDKIKQICIYALVGFLVVMMGLFTVGDALNISGPDAVAQVDGKKIYKQQYDNSLKQLREQFGRYMQRPLTDADVKRFGLEQSALRNLINSDVTKFEVKDLGLSIGDEQVGKAIKADQRFATDGKFDVKKVKDFIDNTRFTERTFKDAMRQDLASAAFQTTFQTLNFQDGALVEKIAQFNTEKRIGLILNIPTSLVGEIADPDETVLATYYEAEKEKYRAPEYRAVEYIKIDEKNVRANITVDEETIFTEYEEIKDTEFSYPEKYRFKRRVNDNRDKVLETAETKFGEFSKAELLATKTFSDADIEKIYALKEGESSEILSSEFGFQQLTLVKIIPEGIKPFEEIRSDLGNRIEKEQVMEKLLQLSADIEDSLASGADMAKTAEEFNLVLYKTQPISFQGKPLNSGKFHIGEGGSLPVFGDFLSVMHKTDLNTESAIIASDDNMQYYILSVTEIVEPRDRALDEVHPQVVEAWKIEEKNRLTESKAKEIANKISSKETMEAEAKAIGQTVIKTDTLYRSSVNPRQSQNADIIDKIFLQGKNIISEPIKQPDNSYNLVMLDSIIAPDVNDPLQGSKVTADNLTKEYQAAIRDAYFKHLYKKYDVRIYEQALTAPVIENE